jgi:glycosyltransferase involved in cell wall biosynthesis
MPMRNCEPFVRRAIESVLDQPGVNLELIVIDDGSTDRSAQVARAVGDPRVRVIQGPEQGIAAALNAGLAVATGEYFARCDADDHYVPDRLGWQVRYLQEHPEFGAVVGSYTHVDEDGEFVSDRTWGRTGHEVTSQIRRGVGRCHLCAFVVRMSEIRALGGFRTYFVATEDADLILRLGERCRVWYEPRCCYIYRLHDSSITHTQPSVQRRFLEQIVRTFQKQRLVSGMDDLMRGCAPPIPHGDDNRARGAEEQIQALLLGAAWQAHDDGRRREALSTGLRACMVRPTALRAWWSLLALAVKPRRADAQRDAAAPPAQPVLDRAPVGETPR